MQMNLENTLIDIDNMTLLLKGFNYITNESVTFKRTNQQGFQAPEVESGETYDPIVSDIFALGIILFTMVAGHLPFARADPSDRLYRIFSSKD